MRIMRELTRRGPVFIANKLGMQASTVGRVLRRNDAPLLRELDPVTGKVIRATRQSANRYEHDHPGSLVHIDVKKLGRIPDGGGWRADPTQTAALHRTSHHKLGYDFVHAAIDDHSRVAYVEIHDDERGETCAGFLERAIAFYAALGVKVERVITDNAFAYRHSTAFHTVLAQPQHHPEVHPPALPLDERESRTSQPHPRDRMGILADPSPRTPNAAQPCQPGSTTTT